MNTPNVERAKLWPGKGCTLPSGVNLPLRAPKPEHRPGPPSHRLNEQPWNRQSRRKLSCLHPARPRAAAPDPVTRDRIHESNQDEAEHHEGTELDAFRDHTGNDRCGGAGEHELEEELGQQRNTRPGNGGIIPFVIRQGGGTVIRTGKTGKPLHSHIGIAVTKHQSPPDDIKDREAQANTTKFFAKMFTVFFCWHMRIRRTQTRYS